MPELHLTNTLTRTKERFVPIDPANVRMYVCGPTVYQRIHIGNARPIIIFDILFRLLRQIYGEAAVSYVRNITDIDDKIIDQAKANGEPIEALTARTSEAFLADCVALGCLSPSHQPRATAHIEGMVQLIGLLVAKGHAYEAEGHVLFSVPSMPDYGQLSNRSRDEMVAGARVEVAPYKRDPADFILWKPSKDGQPGWDSPWGRGRPGWHIECSAMAEALLGPLPFDIHGGGLDLIFPHHENEIAQSRGAHDASAMARYWVHNGFVDMRGEKMSKSLGNVLRVDDALAIVPGEAIRFFILGAHYRQPLDCTPEGLREAEETLTRFYKVLELTGLGGPDDDEEGQPAAEFLAALSDDLNTPRAIAELHGLATRVFTAHIQERDPAGARGIALTFKASAKLLGLLNDDPAHWLRGRAGVDGPRIEALIEERRAARAGRDFARADAIRKQLADEGVELEDRKDGTTGWVQKRSAV
ncbi:cysteine--tRNA ligase [Arboricoccus pini]|uniref:cysteine--tRNA ligase n=1 Tax=Arboricoccus pini TaxID=1963835 RepID=UPI001A9CA82B|nr:cysteine--tRNA ligase [Arboricoccus pini]